MNFTALRRFRNLLRNGHAAHGLWVTLESPSVVEMAVTQGLDWVVIDAEHGHLDWSQIAAHLRAAARSQVVALVRLAEVSESLIKRALDIGADGVVLPRIESAGQLCDAVRFSKYPPNGTRGIGAERATGWGQSLSDYIEQANDQLLVVPIIESVAGRDQLDEILNVPGIDVVFFGPADYSASAGFVGQWQGDGVAEAILEMLAIVQAQNKFGGVVATDREDLLRRSEEGFRMLGVGLDSGLLLAGMRERLAPHATAPGNRVSKDQPLAHPPENLRPDRSESITTHSDATIMEIAAGVRFHCFVGEHNQSRGLTTGIVTIEPGAQVPYHRHPFSESMTLLEGSAEVEVEGRCYQVGRLDNVTVPARLAHCVRAMGDAPAVFHIAMSSERISRELVAYVQSRIAMPRCSTGRIGAENIVRTRSAAHYDAGDGTRFVDFCNDDLLPGIEMSGGYGLFDPGGRLPAHCHDFDESISIIDGTANCLVEGRRYSLGDRATALQPRGRIHYFINDTQESMAMIWFYAGPAPVRIVVEETMATEAGAAWYPLETRV